MAGVVGSLCIVGSLSTRLAPKVEDGLKGRTLLPAKPVGCDCRGVMDGRAEGGDEDAEPPDIVPNADDENNALFPPNAEEDAEDAVGLGVVKLFWFCLGKDAKGGLDVGSGDFGPEPDTNEDATLPMRPLPVGCVRSTGRNAPSPPGDVGRSGIPEPGDAVDTTPAASSFRVGAFGNDGTGGGGGTGLPKGFREFLPEPVWCETMPAIGALLDLMGVEAGR